jgi:TetR/AcrR family transcriptional regulator, transcriptional repressor for nem operon
MRRPNDYVKQQMSMLTEKMVERLNTDKEAGHLSVEIEPQIVVPIVIAYLQGIWRMALVSYDRATFEGQIDLFVTSLGLCYVDLSDTICRSLE